MIFTLSNGQDVNLPGKNAFGVVGKTRVDIIFDGNSKATIDFKRVGESGLNSGAVGNYVDVMRNMKGVSASQSGAIITISGNNLPNMQHIASALAGRAMELKAVGHGDVFGDAFENTVRKMATEGQNVEVRASRVGVKHADFTI